jgi:hypothetical protein
MEHDTHCELGQYIKSFSNIYWMIHETKYLIKLKWVILYYAYHKYTHNSLNLNDYVYLCMSNNII